MSGSISKRDPREILRDELLRRNHEDVPRSGAIAGGGMASPMGGSTRHESRDGRSMQIVALLNQLGDRIIRSEQDRADVRAEIAATRASIENLESRAEQTERIFLTIHDKMAKNDGLEAKLLARQDSLERVVKDNVERMKRAEALTVRIEEAIATQNRLAHRLEKTAQDKAQILSKIERIEISVERTRQALGSGVPLNPRTDRPSNNNAENPAPWWTRPYKTQVAMFTSVMIAGLLAGVALTQLGAHWPKGAAEKPAAVAAVQRSMPVERTAALAARTGDNYALNIPETALVTTSTAPQDLAAYTGPADLPSEQDLIAAVDNPDAIAARLNAIEPVTGPVIAEPVIAARVEDNEEAVADMAPVALTPADTARTVPPAAPAKSRDDFVTEDFIKAQIDRTIALKDRIAPDKALPEALRRVEQKAFEGVPEAQHDLAAIYTAGHGGVEINYTRAAAWFEEAAANGVANARYNLGVLYHQGLGVPRDIGKAISWYRAAADMDHPEAQYNLGIAFIEGIGTEYNPQAAARNFEKAARGGVKEAAYNLGLIHENGLLGAPDMNEAVFWYKTAADHSPEAKVALDQVVKALGLRGSDVTRIMTEYGKVYKLTGGPVVSTPPKPDESTAAKVASLLPQDQVTPGETKSLSEIIPKLTEEESRGLISSINKDQAMIAQIQEQLMRLGLYPGPADGVGGPQTEDAIRSYQKKTGMKESGKPTEDLLIHMLASEINAASGGEDENGSRPD